MQTAVTDEHHEREQHQSGLNRNFRANAEMAMLFALIAAWILFHVRFFLHAGALWRDEVNSVDLCNSAHISDIWNNLEYDSFPMLWHLLLRFWIRSGIGSSDQGIRVLGLLAGLGILAAILFNARQFRTRPVIALTLLGFSTAVICYGGSVRAYGLGLMLEVLTFSLIWKVARRPTIANFIAALLVALAAVQMLFYNSVILAAICCGAFVLTASHRQWKRAGLIAAIGLLCAASMTIYGPAIHRSNSFRAMLYVEPGLLRFLGKFGEAVSYAPANEPDPSALNLATWEITTLLAIFLGAAALISRRRSIADPFRRDVLIYHFTVLCAGLLGYLAFLWHLSYFMQPWYFLAIMALIAMCADGLIGSIQSPLGRTLLLVAAASFAGVAALPVWRDAGLRKTAIDTDATQLTRLSKSGDLILVSPWYYGVTFQRYYHGPADYETIPPVGFLAYHKYDLQVPWMQNIHAMDGTVHRMANVLRSGHVVFLFGEFHCPSTDVAYPAITRPAPDNPLGWMDGDYYDLWQREITFILAQHAVQTVPVPTDWFGVSHYERPRLYAVRGWTDFSQSVVNAATRPQN
jgi:hypothetical protein